MKFAIHCGPINPTNDFIEAVRTQPSEPDDSGWQVFPKETGFDMKEALVIGLVEMLEVYPRLQEIIASPIGSRFILHGESWKSVE